MTDNERYELLAAMYCQLRNDADEDLRLFRGTEQHGETDLATDHFYNAYIRLWGLNPPRRIIVDCTGEITAVQVLKPQPLDRPELVQISRENWDVPAIDKELVQMAIARAKSILEAVETYSGKTEVVTKLLTDASSRTYRKDLERLIEGFVSYAANKKL